MIHEAKAITLSAMMDEQHRKQHPKFVKGCEYCDFLKDGGDDATPASAKAARASESGMEVEG